MISMTIPDNLRKRGVVSVMVHDVKTRSEVERACTDLAETLRKFDEAIEQLPAVETQN